ncbi:hypothetical protein Nwi_2898 [Nitrobacter winogradskyi Nb-255]|uniref:Copper-binding protein n=1 Tax=Nitrobacter winogradskyi (strain ATCC 25391 / DSM 10237 / CIP 104748 / NCIMB 11846 / Nb-255) TaxID=323098 RepID=Q3SNJ3_NITWN|nr:copper-binding protein [Nitrobacter winogradskyi]ABA06148.1 hypothetical protein Nwi_2898 [Nitrobacter winogradskyi Nb-255]
MRYRIFVWTIAATAVILDFGKAHAFSSGDGAAARARGTEFLLVQVHKAKNETRDRSDALFQAVGFVTAINPATGSLTINHEEIVGLMPPMEMVFQVEPPTLSEGVKPGDKVEFRIDGKTYRVRELKVIEQSE